MEFKHSNLSLSENDEELFHVPNVLYENRYCNQDDFSILVCGGGDEYSTASKDVYEIKGATLEGCKFPSMLEARYQCKTAVINSDVLVVGCFRAYRNNICSIEYTKSNINLWLYKTDLPDKRDIFSICSFKKQLYIVGGRKVDNCPRLKSCFIYSLNCDRWSQITDMIEKRAGAACTVYEGKIVVSGGLHREGLKSVEAYDYYEDKWTLLPDMIESRSDHCSVSFSNKLFVIGGVNKLSSEVFDSISRTFSYIKIDILLSAFGYDWKAGACCVGDKIIVVFINHVHEIKSVVYDTKNK